MDTLVVSLDCFAAANRVIPAREVTHSSVHSGWIPEALPTKTLAASRRAFFGLPPGPWRAARWSPAGLFAAAPLLSLFGKAPRRVASTHSCSLRCVAIP